jgi:hypothetical protein
MTWIALVTWAHTCDVDGKDDVEALLNFHEDLYLGQVVPMGF